MVICKCSLSFLNKRLLTSIIFVVTTVLAGCMAEPVSHAERNDSNNKGGNTGGPNTSKVGGFINGYWQESQSLVTEDRPSTSVPHIKSQRLDVAKNIAGNEVVYLSWRNVSNTGEKLRLMRYSYQASQSKNAWNGPDGTNYQPLGIPDDASSTQFGVNPSTADGYALWSSGTTLSISEFMGTMGHYMGATASLPMGHAANFVSNASGDTT